MSEAFASLLRRLLGTDRVRRRDPSTYDVELDGLHTVVERYSAKQLGFRTISLEGFVLRIGGPPLPKGGRITQRSASPNVDVYRFDGDDLGMNEAWIDLPARAALVRAATLIRQAHGGDARILCVPGEVGNGRVTLWPPWPDDEQHLELVLRAGIALAQRPHRIAAELRALFDPLGVELLAEEWRLDDRCYALFRRGTATVTLDWRRNLDRQPSLRTRLRASGPDCPADADQAWLDARLATMRPLVQAANAAAITLSRGEVTLLWNGLIRNLRMVAPALELLCRLVSSSASVGPYR